MFLNNNFKPTGAYFGEKQYVENGQKHTYAYKQSLKFLLAQNHHQHQSNKFFLKCNAAVSSAVCSLQTNSNEHYYG